jgi:endonuclease/exonuclease/phosphatase (EEP) superfamily protein YafD
LLRIDHVLGAGVIAVNVRVLPLVGGDHSALVVDLVSEG